MPVTEGGMATTASVSARVGDQRAGHRFTVRQITSAIPSGPERPNAMAYREVPATFSVTSRGARSKEPTSFLIASPVKPRQSVLSESCCPLYAL